MDSCLVFMLGTTAITALIVAIQASQRARAASTDVETLRSAIEAFGKKPAAEAATSPIPSTPTIPPPPRFEPPPWNPSPAPQPPEPAAQPSRPTKPLFEPRLKSSPRLPFDWEALVGVKLFS